MTNSASRIIGWCGHARRALAEVIEAVAPPNQVLPLVVLAVVGAFGDLCSASTATPDLIEQRRRAGLAQARFQGTEAVPQSDSRSER